jgi:hypothetical protein
LRYPIPCNFNTSLYRQAHRHSEREAVSADMMIKDMDATSKQLIAETRVPIAAKQGRTARFDYEYQRQAHP